MKRLRQRLGASRATLAATTTAAACALMLSACGTSNSGSGDPTRATAQACAGITAGQRIGDGTILSSSLVPAAMGAPAYCEVTGSIPTKTRFVVRMPSPAAQWSGRTLYTGGGGFNGNLAPVSTELLGRGYAMIASTGGNDVPNTGNFALDPVALDDYADKSVHRTSLIARQIIRGFYGREMTRNYFEGCSNGGREGLISAQRYPQDFDGIVARAPASNFENLFLGFTRTNKAANVPGSGLSLAKVTSLNQAVLKSCDALDGIADGIVGRPAACRFDLDVVRCTGAESDACLTPPQIAVARTLYEPYVIDGQQVTSGYNPGSEATWNGSQTGEKTASLPRYSNLFADHWVRYFVTHDASATALQFDPSQPANAARIAELRKQIDSTDPNLSAFRARQGKLILYHGLADAAISPKETVAYYNDVVRASGGQAETDKYVRLYLNPGVGHCTGGPGPDVVDLLAPLQDWVENGVDPASKEIVAVKLDKGRNVLSRPLCRFPGYPRYKGRGESTEASSFVCETAER